ncbi:MAG: hypothetical protein QNI87_05130 [Erythrobacter sp.]|uniref:hypothetical protein n=1 Tax=Erythrobacter sp. TaxID=1042 RepID=UPI0026388668|nr:hypothetical protein [Erythrobacter sp.]MDJ0977900.1 hypothetical protein [Erythrobacter sp.]
MATVTGQPVAAHQVSEDDMEDVKDVAKTPLEDLGLSKEELADVLLASLEDPYAPAGNGRCNALVAEIARLDTVLGDDYDIAEKDEDGIHINTKKAAKDLVGSLIPFRGVVREISGAAGDKRKAEAAVTAGVARRSYLKGLGQAKGCKYPARPKAE